MSEAQTVKTALHEASHASLHNKAAMNADSDKKLIKKRRLPKQPSPKRLIPKILGKRFKAMKEAIGLLCQL